MSYKTILVIAFVTLAALAALSTESDRQRWLKNNLSETYVEKDGPYEGGLPSPDEPVEGTPLKPGEDAGITVRPDDVSSSGG